MDLSLMLIALGIASDNLMLAALSGNGFTLLRNHKWVLILLLMFIIQNQVLLYSDWFGGFTKNWLNGSTPWMGIGIMLSIGLKMIQELKIKNQSFQNFHFDTGNVLTLAAGTSIYVFAFGCVANWLDVSDRAMNLSLLPLIASFLIGGLLLGKFHRIRILKVMHGVCVMMVLLGVALLFIQKITRGS